MAANFFSATEALQVWDNVKDDVKSRIAITRSRDPNSLDYSFITPTLLGGVQKHACADPCVHPSHVGMLTQRWASFLSPRLANFWTCYRTAPSSSGTSGSCCLPIYSCAHNTDPRLSPTRMYSGKSLSSDGKVKLKNQVIDAPWVTPGQFTQAPSLDCIFSQCYSIKSWLDLRSDHVAIVHCSNGRSRSGILIACLLKYIGAFDHASAAFDFFCSARCVGVPIYVLVLHTATVTLNLCIICFRPGYYVTSSRRLRRRTASSLKTWTRPSKQGAIPTGTPCTSSASPFPGSQLTRSRAWRYGTCTAWYSTRMPAGRAPTSARGHLSTATASSGCRMTSWATFPSCAASEDITRSREIKPR